MLRGERDQPNPYVPIFVDDHLDHRAEDGWQRSILRAAILGFVYAHLAFFAGSLLLGALIGAIAPFGYSNVLLFGLEGMRAALVGVFFCYVFVVPAFFIMAFGIVNGIVVNYWQSHLPGAFFLWCSAIDLLVLICLTLASR